ncbi:MAG: type IV secretory system conjugative DNA transfer family protein [Streptomycetaceae bacterium]|nr:type IV secretory system conjugative DNA transfer family protein [Streptomycetaceae bacterium]
MDRAARHLGDARRIDRAVNPWLAHTGTSAEPLPGLLIGRTVHGQRDIRAGWDQMHLDICGPRTGKNPGRAIPGILSAPGNVVVTSNKRDVVDATRGPRAERGPVWIFDPQQQVGAAASWWWNPLGFVDGSPTRADLLAGLFMSVQRRDHQRSDGYFEPAARSLLGALLLAADAENLPITRILHWLMRPTDDTPVRILQDAGHDMSAASAERMQTLPSEQRSGVYGTAAQLSSFLTAPDVTAWITPGGDRPELKLEEFAARSDQTAYLLSDETHWAAAPLTLAFTSALAYAHEGVAIDSPSGRLARPALFVLDEAANVCPWPELPSLYSHLGARGISMMITLQSWHQGAAAWGETGMARLWGAAGVRVYGGGVADIPFLEDLSQASGVFEPETTSVSAPPHTAWWNRTVTRASRSEPVLDASDLVALPRGRAFVQVSGAPPVLVRTVPWWEGPHAEQVRDSIARYGPSPSNSGRNLAR